MNYQVYTPAAELQSLVKCYWTLEDEASALPVRQRVVPDGCMEMIFHYGDLYRQYLEDGSSLIQPRSFVFGQITSFLEIEPTGASGIVAVRFFPDGLTPFIDMPASCLENRAVGLQELFGEKGMLLEQEVIAAPGNEKRMELIENFLLSRLTEPATIDTITKACVETIFQAQGQIAVTELADKMKMNRRNMERKFLSVIGMSPKQLSRVVRLQSALKMMEQKKCSNLTDLAYENGYYDQAHFIRDFKEFTGTSPRSFFAKNTELSALFIAAE